MGISVELWRARVSLFRRHSGCSLIDVSVGCTRYRLMCVITYLLFIGCVELNPRPPTVDFHVQEKRLDDFAIEVKTTRELAQHERKEISDQLDHHITETTAKIIRVETSLSAAVLHIATLERSLAAANNCNCRTQGRLRCMAHAIATEATGAQGVRYL